MDMIAVHGTLYSSVEGRKKSGTEMPSEPTSFNSKKWEGAPVLVSLKIGKKKRKTERYSKASNTGRNK